MGSSKFKQTFFARSKSYVGNYIKANYKINSYIFKENSPFYHHFITKCFTGVNNFVSSLFQQTQLSSRRLARSIRIPDNSINIVNSHL